MFTIIDSLLSAFSNQRSEEYIFGIDLLTVDCNLRSYMLNLKPEAILYKKFLAMPLSLQETRL